MAAVVYHGGTILTMVDDRREVDAVAIRDGRIVGAGTIADATAAAGADASQIDLAGRTMMPAFIDSHGHFMNATMVVRWANVQGVPAGPVTNVADIVATLHAHVERWGIEPGEWIIGYGYDRSNLDEARELTVDDLDPHFPDNPIMLIHSSNHGAVLNSAAFASVGYDEHTETPAGGIIVRKPGSNVPAGYIMETAFLPIYAGMQKPSENELLGRLFDAQQIYASAGVATCQEGAANVKDVAFLRRAAASGELYIDVNYLPLVLDVPALVKESFPNFTGGPFELPEGSAAAFGTYQDRLKLQGIKFFTDGSPQGKTAFWTEPLLTPGPGGETNWRGQPVIPPEAIYAGMQEVIGKGIQIYCHSNGDAGIDIMIEGVRRAGVQAADDRRLVVIHSQCMRPDQLDSYAELGLSPSFFTAHCFYWGDEHLANLGPERASFLSPMRSAFDKGLRCSNHADFSVTPMEPLRIIWSSIARRSKNGTPIGPDQAIDRWQALKSMTIEAAWQLFEEDAKGTIEIGKLADLVILDANPLDVELDAIPDIGVIETIKEGVTVFPPVR
jgi:predicted amidohydrolase YtcJ